MVRMLAQSSVINEIFHVDMEYDQYYTSLIITMPGFRRIHYQCGFVSMALFKISIAYFGMYLEMTEDLNGM